MDNFLIQHANYLFLCSFLIGLLGGFFLRHRQYKKKEDSLEKVVESMYSRNIDRAYQNLKNRKYEETLSRNEDKLSS